MIIFCFLFQLLTLLLGYDIIYHTLMKGKVKKMPDNSRAINRVFTCGVISGLLRDGKNEIYDYVISRCVNDPENKTHGEIISEIYACLGKERRNEYYYTN